MRIIAKLEVKDSYLVKGMQYEGLRKIGNIIKLIDTTKANMKRDEIIIYTFR